MSRPAFLTCTAAVLALVAADPAAAGDHLTAVESIESPAGVQRMTFEAWVARGQVRIEIRGGDVPLFKSGSFLLLRDAGKSLYLVDPAAKAYSQLNLQAGLGAMAETLGFSDPKVEKLLDEDGGPILGYPTRHTRYRMTYTMTGKASSVMTAKVSTEKEAWATLQVPDEGFGAWLRTGDSAAGDPELEKLLAGMRDSIQGFPLKVTVTTTMTMAIGGKPGKPRVTRVTAEVSSLETATVDDSRFDIPAGYQERPLPSPPTPGSGP
jgi:hypothetical protein